MKDVVKAIGIICGIFTVPVVGSLAVGVGVYKMTEAVLHRRTEKKQKQERQDEVTQVLKIVIEHK